MMRYSCSQPQISSAGLGSTDAAGRVPHRSPTQGAATDAAAHALVPCLSILFYFILFYFYFNGFVPTRLWFALIQAEPGKFSQNQVVSAESDHIGWRPKLALNHTGTAEISFEWGPNILNLSFLNFILNLCYFFCIFFFVLCFDLCFLPLKIYLKWKG